MVLVSKLVPDLIFIIPPCTSSAGLHTFGIVPLRLSSYSFTLHAWDLTLNHDKLTYQLYREQLAAAMVVAARKVEKEKEESSSKCFVGSMPPK
jgi:hypothetical protein